MSADRTQSYEWRTEYRRLWSELVPPSGQAPTIQGELIRAVGRLSDEAQRNGNINWSRDYERMVEFLRIHLTRSDFFQRDEIERIDDGLDLILATHDNPDVSGVGSPLYLVAEKAVDWCMAHPEPMPHQNDSQLHI